MKKIMFLFILLTFTGCSKCIEYKEVKTTCFTAPIFIFNGKVAIPVGGGQPYKCNVKECVKYDK